MGKFLRIHEVAEQLKVSPSMVRVYANKGQISFDLTPSKQRVFTQAHVDEFLGKTPAENPAMVFYIRSSNGNKTLLETQTTLLTEAYGSPHKVVKDNGSGLNENRKGLETLMNQAKKKEFNILCITERDRLTRFGYKYLEEFFASHGVTIKVLGEPEQKTLNEELLQDFMSLIASFIGKFYRLRGYEQKKQLLRTAGNELDKTTD